MNRSRTLFACLVILTASPAAAEPCGGLAFDGGRVVSARPLRAVEKPAPVEAECLDAIGKQLGGRASVRSITVAVRLSDAERAAGAGMRIGDQVKAALVRGGVPEARVSVVVPTATEGEQGTLAITFTEKRAERSVAVVEAMGGVVSAGADRSALAPLTRGATLDPDTYISTGAGATAWIGLADGSRLRLAENSLLFIGRLHLDDKLERVVRLQLISGELEAQVRSAGQSSVFDVSTRFGTAGVRGTRFRLAASEAGTRLETLDGTVELAAAGDHPALSVTRGQGAAVSTAGDARPAVPLLGAPTAVSPLEGKAKVKDGLKWQAVPQATGYAIDLARDAEFTYEVRHYDSAQPALALNTEVEAGKWYWRVAAVGTDGFTGPTSKVHAFEIAR